MYDKAIAKTVKASGAELVVLAGFMRILNPAFLNETLSTEETQHYFRLKQPYALFDVCLMKYLFPNMKQGDDMFPDSHLFFPAVQWPATWQEGASGREELSWSYRRQRWPSDITGRHRRNARQEIWFYQSRI